MDLSSYNAERSLKSSNKAPRSERDELVGIFLARLNADRGKYAPLTASRLGMMLAHVKTSELYFFLKKCEGAGSFGRCFWGSLSTKNIKK